MLVMNVTVSKQWSQTPDCVIIICAQALGNWEFPECRDHVRCPGWCHPPVDPQPWLWDPTNTSAFLPGHSCVAAGEPAPHLLGSMFHPQALLSDVHSDEHAFIRLQLFVMPPISAHHTASNPGRNPAHVLGEDSTPELPKSTPSGKPETENKNSLMLPPCHHE